MIKRIFLDMDGVLCNFVSGVAKVFDTTEEEIYEKWEPGVYDVATPLGISEEKMWAEIKRHGESYWSYLEPYPWAKQLFNACKQFAPTTIATSPNHDPKCLSGKLKWLNTYLAKNLLTGEDFRDYLIGPRKEMCAAEGHILIDDSDAQCKKFVEHGGKAILFPRHWNRAHHVEMNQYTLMNYIKERLLALLYA